MIPHTARNSRRKRSVVFFLLASSLVAPRLTQAAIVTLENGDQITGDLGQLSNGVLTVKSGIFGEIKIPWNKISKLVSNDDVRIQLNDGAILKGKVALDAGGAVTVDEQRSEPPKTLPRQEIAALNPPIIDDTRKYTGKVDLGGTFNRGNSEDNQLHNSGELVGRTPEDRYTVNWEINEAKSGGIKTTSNRRLLTQYDLFLDKKNYVFVNAKGERDELAGLNLRTALGGGYGRQFVDTDITKLSGEIGLSYVNEDYSASPERSFPSLSLGFKYEEKFLSQKLTFFNNLNVDASLEQSDDVLLHNRMGFRIPIASGINLSTQFNIDYDNDPAIGKKKTDTALIFSVGYAF